MNSKNLGFKIEFSALLERVRIEGKIITRMTNIELIQNRKKEC